MKILLVGDLRHWTRTSQRLRAFRRTGHRVTGLSTVPVDLPMPNGSSANLLDRIRHRIGRPRDRTGVNAEIERELAEARGQGDPYDLLWVEKARELRTATVLGAKTRHPETALAYFTEDDLLRRDNRSAWTFPSLSSYDVVFTTKSTNARDEELPRLGAGRVSYVPKSFDPELHRPVVVEPEAIGELGAQVGFVGTFEEPRAAALLALAQLGVAVRVWGNGWHAWRGRDRNLAIEGRAIYGEDYVRAISSTSINLGFLRRSSRDQHTDRSVEVPACGGFLLTERTAEHQAMFREGGEVELFHGVPELLLKVRHYLARPDELRRIAEAGRRRVVADAYDHDAMLARMLDEVERARSGRPSRRNAA